MSEPTTAGTLAVHAEQTEWTPAQEAVLRQSGIDDSVSPAELSSFLHLCQRTQLDPFSRQIYLIGRWNNQAGRKVFTPQTSIDGYRVIAHRAAGTSHHSLGYDDTLWCGPDGAWRDVWLADEPPAAAKVTVIRNGERFSAVARFTEYAQTTNQGKLTRMWASMSATMIAKCAESLALRKAFPHDLAGVYTAEEMAQADQPARGPQVQQQTQPAREFLREAMDAKDADTVRRIWQEAKAYGSHPDALEQIAEVGRQMAAAAPEPEPVEAVVVEEEMSEAEAHAAATAALMAFAEEHGITEADIEVQARRAIGEPVHQAQVKDVWALLAMLQDSVA